MNLNGEVMEPPPFSSLSTEWDEGTEPFEDTEFPAEMPSVYRPGQKAPPGSARIKQWLRPAQIAGVTNPNLFVDGMKSLDVAQGGLGDW